MSDTSTISPRKERQQIPPSTMMNGFYSTPIGLLPNEWEARRLGDDGFVSRVGSGITPRGGQRLYKPFGRPFVRSQNVGWGQLLLDELAFIDEETHASFASSQIAEGDVLLNITGASIGRCAVANSVLALGNVNQHVCEIRTDPGKLDPYFLCYFILSEVGQHQIDSFQAGGNRQGLNFGQIRSLIIPLPSPREQRAIAAALSDVDELIAALDKLIAKKLSIKLATTQQLLTGKTRLPGFSGEWVWYKLGDLGEFTKGRGIKRDDVSDEGFACVRYGELYTRYNNYISDPTSRVNRKVAESALPIRHGDLLFAGSGETAEEIGKCVAYVGEVEAYAGGDIVVLTPGDRNPVFLGHLMNHRDVALQKACYGQGDAVVHISSHNLALINLPLPSNEEQDAIAHVLLDMDAEISALEQRRDKTRAIKQGMMQQLLTGRIRLVEPEGTA